MTVHNLDLIGAAQATACGAPGRGAIAKFAQDRHKRAARMILYALVADDPAIWNQTAAILAHRLTERETAALAFAALRALDPEARAMTCDAATHDDGPRDPVPSGWNLDGIIEWRAARDRRAVRP
jgi:hypothetical protein